MTNQGTGAAATIARISTHLLDTAAGRPAAGVPVLLQRVTGDGATVVGRGVTDDDGRVGQLNDAAVGAGDYSLTFDTDSYFRGVGGTVFYPSITVHVRLDGGRAHYHVPVLASTFSYATYLGS